MKLVFDNDNDFDDVVLFLFNPKMQHCAEKVVIESGDSFLFRGAFKNQKLNFGFFFFKQIAS